MQSDDLENLTIFFLARMIGIIGPHTFVVIQMILENKINECATSESSVLRFIGLDDINELYKIEQVANSSDLETKYAR